MSTISPHHTSGTSHQPVNSESAVWLDVLRAVAALLVVMEHLASRLFLGYGDLPATGIAVKTLYLLNLLGSPAVVVFFVLSGLLISRSILASTRDGQWAWKPYLINRFTRLYIVLIPCLGLTLLLDLAAAQFGNYNLRNLSWTNFFGNLAFLQTITVTQFGSNGPLWSLANEFWYYIAFPLIVVCFHRKGLPRTAALGLAITILLFIGPQKSAYFLIWMIGTAVLLAPRVAMADRPTAPLAALGLLIAFVLIRPIIARGRVPYIGEVNLFWPDLFVGIATGLLIYILLQRKHTSSPNRWWKLIAAYGAKVSFTLYLLHYPLLNCVYFVAKRYGFEELQPTFGAILLEVILVAVICASALCIAAITEFRTEHLRHYLTRVLQRQGTMKSERSLTMTPENGIFQSPQTHLKGRTSDNR